MSKRIIIFPLFFFLFVGPWGCFSQAGGGINKVCFYDECIKVEVVQTQAERARGLQSRRSLGRDEGMLFIFPSSRRQNFWMKDTFIPLDIIWMDGRKRIVFVIPNIPPCETDQCPVYSPDTDANYVLEVNAGVAAEMGLSIGDQAEF